MWPDNETDEDLLGFEIHANLVESIITEPTMLPVTVGLFGDWGGGKSSILKILQRNLSSSTSSEPETVVVYFDSWVFQGYEDAKTAILAVLLKHLKECRGLKEKIFDEAEELLKRVNWMKVAKTGLAAGVSYLSANPLPIFAMFQGHSSKEESGEKDDKPEKGKSGEDDKWLRDVAESTDDVRTFRRDFEKMLKKTSLKSLVVLIDDLDRCSPDRVIDNLEAIKLFLNVKGMAFVIAADRRIVENAIRVRYAEALSSAGLDQAERNGLVIDYLEKLVQVPYTLPKLAPHEVRSYLSLLLLKKILPEQFTALRSEYAKFISENRYDPFDLRAHISLPAEDARIKEVEEAFRLIETAADPITEGLKGNPRQIKRFLNALWMRLQLAKVARLTSLDQAVMIKLMVLEYINGDRFKEVYDWHRASSDGTVAAFEELENTPQNANPSEALKLWQQPQLTRWLRTAPLLKDVDLRDYFWLARSALEQSFSGIQMVSKAVRRCVDDLLSGDMGSRNAGTQMHDSLQPSEKREVAAALSKAAYKAPEKPEPLQALFELASKGSMEAANDLVRVLMQSDPNRINLRVAQGLGALSSHRGVESVEMLIKARQGIIARKGMFGTALSRAIKK